MQSIQLPNSATSLEVPGISGSTRYSLDDKYKSDEGTAYMTGIQALVRLTMAQTRRDALSHLKTAGFVSGYRGSPLGNFDSALWQADTLLATHNVVFQPGVNEDLAATAAWGTQQSNLAGHGKYDGVVAWWYGKGPGVDRSGDALRHANLAGTARHGGVVALYGDDHSCKSSSIPHQSEHVMIGCGIPILYPTSVQQILDFGTHAVSMSRNAGVWTSMKLVSEIVETSASVHVDLLRIQPSVDDSIIQPPGGLNIRWPDRSLDQEERLYKYRLPAAIAYARANNLNKIVWDCSEARIGIAASGKGYLDTVEALRLLGLEGAAAKRLGLRLYQVGMIWPIEPYGLRQFARGLQEIIVVEEKRPILEAQIKDELYSLPDHARPRVIGKSADGLGEWSTPVGEAPLISHYELQPEPIAKMLASRFLRLAMPEDLRQMIQDKFNHMTRAERESKRVIEIAERKAYFCSGCPHNSSTVVPEGSRALGGIGCHFLALTMDRGTETFSQMGGEGASWVGASHFTNERHVFANIGDGTYFHSGYLAIRQAVAANVNITYKILYNDAVGMTGGQHVDGQLSVPQLTRQLAAEGVGQQIIVTDEPDLLNGDVGLATGVSIRPRSELIKVQQELREIPGVTALIYAQTCASEKRRRRKRKEYPDPEKRAFIHTEICEGCGDCSKQSNCLSIEPIKTELGVKRQINQGNCNKDFSCVDGFCPSFVTVNSRDVSKKPPLKHLPTEWPPEIQPCALDSPIRIIVGGVGGTGVVTVGALLGMAAHLEGKATRVMDMAGMAQKGGTVYSYVQIAGSDEEIAATKVTEGQCDVLIGADAIVAGSTATLSRLKANCFAVVNDESQPTSDFIKSRDWTVPINDLMSRLTDRLKGGRVVSLPAVRIATQTLGDPIFANLVLLGMAWQSGRLPLMRSSIEKAIELNGTAATKNLEAFRIGCHLESSPELRALMSGKNNGAIEAPSLEDLINDRCRRLTEYWNIEYSEKYSVLLKDASRVLPGEIANTIATQLYRLMAYKDEYEVARLLVSDSFKKTIADTFGDNARLTYHLAPPTLKPGGLSEKREFGQWMHYPMQFLAKMRWLRESAFDIFGKSDERRQEREWRDRYIKFIEQLAVSHGSIDMKIALELAQIPEEIRGFGEIKVKSMKSALKKWDEKIPRLLRS